MHNTPRPDTAGPARAGSSRLRRPLLILLLLIGSQFGTTASGQGFLLGSSPGRDVELGAEVARQVEREYGIYPQPALEAYLREVGQRLVGVVNDPRWQFRFQIVDQAEPNAFAIPGGGIYVSRGLLALVNREDELAGVLAHEIAHVTQRHSARQQRKGFLPGLLSLPGNLVGNVVSENLGALINAPIDTVGGAWLSRYSRGQESESDRLGIRTAAAAGYDPAALADILRRLELDQTTQTGEEKHFNIFDSHPMTETRLKDIRSRSAGLDPAVRPAVAPDPASLGARLDGLWWGENPEGGILRQDRFLQPRLGFTVTFPSGWKHRNTPEYVLSVHPKQEALLILGNAGPAGDPEAIGTRFVQQMRTRARIEPVTTLRMAVGEHPAFVVTYLDRSGRSPTYLHFAWVTMGNHTYQLTGLAPEAHRETLRNAALSLRPLTDLERQSITGKRLRWVAARNGERLEELGARAGNAWPPAYTAVANGWDLEKPLSEGRLVKIAREEPVTGPPGR